MATAVYQCKACGKEFNGGRRLGDHYAEYPDHRPAGKPRSNRGAAGAVAPARTYGR